MMPVIFTSSRMRAVTLLATLLIPPATVSAQDAPAWSSRIAPRVTCPAAERPCMPRAGLVWDTTNQRPSYPLALAAAGIGGEVMVGFVVGADGTVDSSSVRVVRTSNPAFVDPATTAVRRWRFSVDTTGRPGGPTSTQVALIFAHQGVCDGAPPSSQIAWAGENQLVMTQCVRTIPRSQLQPLPGAGGPPGSE